MGALEEKGPKCLKGPKTIYTTIAVAEKQSKRSKKGPFSLHIGSPRSHPGNEINGARRGMSLPVQPGFSIHGCVTDQKRRTIKLGLAILQVALVAVIFFEGGALTFLF